MVVPSATSILNPIILSYTLPICSTSSVRYESRSPSSMSRLRRTLKIDAIGDEWQAALKSWAAFEERIAIGIEQVSLSRGHLEVRMLASTVRPPGTARGAAPTRRSDDRSCPGNVRNRRVAARTGRVHRIVLHVEPRLGHDLAVFGVEQKYEAQHHRQKTGVHVVRTVGKDFSQQRALGSIVRRLKAAQKLVQRIEHLARKGSETPL